MPFVKGDPRINREGRPKGSISVVTRLKQMFAENPAEFEAFIKRYKENPMNEKHITEMIDGKPQQKLEHSGQIKTIAIASEILDKNDIKNETDPRE